MQGLIEESESIISETKDDTYTRDAALIISAQKVEHYEIAAYGGLTQLAKTLDREDIAERVTQRYREAGVDADVRIFIEDMPGAYAAADLIVDYILNVIKT